MKAKIFVAMLSLSLITVFTVVSCSKENLSNKEPGTSNLVKPREGINGHSLRMEIIALPAEDQRPAFEAMSGQEKVAVWLDKLDQALSAEDWNADQEAALSDLRDHVNAELWSDSSASRNYFMDTFHDGWKAGALNLFEYNDLAWIVATLNDYTTGPWSPPASDECDCSLRSDWCPVQMECKPASCITTAHGCGTIWVYKCTGDCDF